jgi:hypothetical protein
VSVFCGRLLRNGTLQFGQEPHQESFTRDYAQHSLGRKLHEEQDLPTVWAVRKEGLTKSRHFTRNHSIIMPLSVLHFSTQFTGTSVMASSFPWQCAESIGNRDVGSLRHVNPQIGRINWPQFP